MVPRKKLQVFVSSTYADLKDERQAAVEAILSTRHIPAGMELFAAGDESQMKVIRRWIDESDVFLLILGGRYGSIEPASGKSYIHLEYEYAQEQGKPFFAVVVDEDYLRKERVKERGADVLETDNPQKLRMFRAEVLTKIVRSWSNPLEIKLAIHETLNEFSQREDLMGWIPGNQSFDAVPLAEENARLSKENAMLRDRLSKVESAAPTFNGVTFEEMRRALQGIEIDADRYDEETARDLRNCVQVFNDSKPSLLHLLWVLKDKFLRGSQFLSIEDTNTLETFGLITSVTRFDSTWGRNELQHLLTDEGRRFLFRLTIEHRQKKDQPVKLPI
jgi:hypothetical protein